MTIRISFKFFPLQSSDRVKEGGGGEGGIFLISGYQFLSLIGAYIPNHDPLIMPGTFQKVFSECVVGNTINIVLFFGPKLELSWLAGPS